MKAGASNRWIDVSGSNPTFSSIRRAASMIGSPYSKQTTVTMYSVKTITSRTRSPAVAEIADHTALIFRTEICTVI